MSAMISAATARELAMCGWTLNKAHTAAHKVEYGMRAAAWHDGRWAVRDASKDRFGGILADGRESCVAYAAMEANEALWSRKQPGATR
jgi:hypothetical protein